MLYIRDIEEISHIEETLGLPVLDGTIKQVKWARGIRVNILVPMKYVAENTSYASKEMFAMMKTEDRSSYWIDNREDIWYYLNLANDHFFSQEFPEVNVYRPAHPHKDGMVDIIHTDGVVYYKYPYDKDFIRIVDGMSHVTASVLYGHPRCTEDIATKMLLSGFTLNSDRELSFSSEVNIPEDLLDDD